MASIVIPFLTIYISLKPRFHFFRYTLYIHSLSLLHYPILNYLSIIKIINNSLSI